MFESEVDLLQAMDDAAFEMAAAHSNLLQAVAEFDERGLWGIDGTSTTQWLGYRYSLTYATASEWVRVARSLRYLPSIAKAYRDGRLSWDQLRPLTKFAISETDDHW